MPNWHAPPSDSLQDAIGKALLDLNLEDDPEFEKVYGMSFDDVIAHATTAIGVLLTSSDMKEGDPNLILQVYCLAFVVGMKYGESRAK